MLRAIPVCLALISKMRRKTTVLVTAHTPSHSPSPTRRHTVSHTRREGAKRAARGPGDRRSPLQFASDGRCVSRQPALRVEAKQKKHGQSNTRAKKSSLYSRPMCMYVSLSLCICPPPQCGVCAQSGPARPRLGFAPGGGGAGSPAQACPGCAGVRTPEVWRVLERRADLLNASR